MAKKNKKKDKFPKSSEILQEIGQYIEDMKEGDKIRVTPLAKSITLASGINPHVTSTERYLNDGNFWKFLIPKVKFHMRNNSVYEIERINPDEETISGEIKFLKKKLNEIEMTMTEILNALQNPKVAEKKDNPEEIKKG